MNADTGDSTHAPPSAADHRRTPCPWTRASKKTSKNHLRPLRAAHPGLTAGEAAPLLPEHLQGPFWERAVDRYLTAELAKFGTKDDNQ